MATIGEFARTYQAEREGLPTVIKIGKATCRGVGLSWVLEGPCGLAAHELRGFAMWRRGTAIIAEEGTA